MRPLSRREKKILEATAGVVGFTLLYLFVFDPFWKEWQRTGGAITGVEAKLRRSALLMKQKATIETEVQNYSTLLKMKDPDQMRTQTLAEIEKITREQALKVIEMRPLSTRRQGVFQEYLVEVDLEGTMSQLLQMIYHLQTTSGLLKVERLQISTKGSQSSLLKAIVTLSRLAKE